VPAPPAPAKVLVNSLVAWWAGAGTLRTSGWSSNSIEQLRGFKTCKCREIARLMLCYFPTRIKVDDHSVILRLTV
jgi:hypothetical protein